MDPRPLTADAECHALALRLALIVQKMRAEARFNFETFVCAAEEEMGGQLMMSAPRKSGSRHQPEARYMGESEITIL